MGRNFHQAKDYTWTDNDNYVGCKDGDQQLFFIAKDGYRDEMINAYMEGYMRGMKHGEASKARKIRRALGIAELKKP